VSSTSEPVRTVPFARPWLDDADRRAVAEVLEGHILTHGPRCQAFEAAFADFLGEGAHAVSVSSCMAALHLASLHFGLGRGDEVVVPAQTHVATAHAVEWVGARPVFVDCDPRDGNVTADRIEAALTDRTRAISLVHFVGIPCSMHDIAALARERGLVLVEDCALAVGSRYDGVHVGLFGDAGCFSFYPVKHLTTAEGGMFVTRHEDVARAVARLRAFGVDRRHDERAIPGLYDVPALGLNYRMSELQAALGSSQLARIEENLARRRQHFERLRDVLLEIPGGRVLDAADPKATSSHYCLTFVLPAPAAAKRAEVVARLQARGVGTSVYYPQPVPRMRYYRDKYGYDPAAFPEAEAISDRSIALPVGPHLDSDDVDHVARSVRAVIEEVS
jgi:dTDP-4-amino-4,6-dideoxygalactose transaminase